MNAYDRELDDAHAAHDWKITRQHVRDLIYDATDMAESETFRERAEDNAYHAAIKLAHVGLAILSRNAYAIGTTIDATELDTVIDALRIAADDRDSEADYSTGDDAADLRNASARYTTLANRLERMAR